MSRYRILFYILLLIVVLGFLKWKFLSPENNSPAGKQGPAQGGSPLRVSGHVVKTGIHENKLFLSGTLRANEEAALVSEASGKIILLNIEEGASVTKDQLLVKINDAELQAQLKKLKSQEKISESREARLKELLQIKGISQEEYDQAQNELNNTRAEMEMVKAQILKTEIRAPFSGTIGLKNISPGNYVTPNTIVATLQQTNPIKVDFSVPERYVSLVRKGGLIRFTTESSKEINEARIVAVEPRIDIDTRTIKVRALCESSKGVLVPGLFAKIEIVLQETENSIMIPSEALVPVLKGYKVFLSKNGKAMESNVITGARSDSTVQIFEGILPGDTLIVSGLMQIRNQADVIISNIH